MTKKYIAPGISQLTPYLMVKDPEATLDFYQQAFGFKLTEEGAMKDEEGKIQHVHMHLEDAHVMFGREGAFGTLNQSPRTTGVLPGASLYVYCSDADAQYKQAVATGAKSLMEPQDSFWGDRMCALEDKDGYHWTFATHTGKTI